MVLIIYVSYMLFLCKFLTQNMIYCQNLITKIKLLVSFIHSLEFVNNFHVVTP